MDALTLAQDLCARICHELGGPLGALSGALELVGEAPEEAMAVARESDEALRRRLGLWRAAAGAGTGPMGRAGLAALLEGALSHGRVVADLSGVTEAAMPAPLAQACLLAAMLGSEALPRGGVVRVEGDGAGLAVRPEGRGAAWPAGVAAGLAGEAAGGPRDVLAPLLAWVAGQAGMVAGLAGDPDGGVAVLAVRPR